jgi:sugar phosphate isomerase/epimerase
VIDRSRLGVVSNCWQFQLAEGQRLEELIKRATQVFGFRQIELRQGALGAFEDSDRTPNAEMLADLAARFPGVSFDLAVELPVFADPVGREDSRRRCFLEAASALSGHLRIVDLTPCSIVEPSDDWLAMAVENLTSLASDLPDGLVSIEHSLQPWSLFWLAFERAWSRNRDNLKLCFDPTNFWLIDDGNQSLEITQSVPVESLSMVHLKQRRGDSTLAEFTDGDVAWRSLLQIFCDRNYAGPFLFEIAPSSSVWNELASGLEYLDNLLARVTS